MILYFADGIYTAIVEDIDHKSADKHPNELSLLHFEIDNKFLSRSNRVPNPHLRLRFPQLDGAVDKEFYFEATGGQN